MAEKRNKKKNDENSKNHKIKSLMVKLAKTLTKTLTALTKTLTKTLTIFYKKIQKPNFRKKLAEKRIYGKK